MSFQPNTEQCVAASFNDGFVRLWDVRTYRLLQLYQPSGSNIQNMVFHPSGSLILIASSDASLRILDLFEGRVAYTIEGHKSSVNCVDCSGKYFASGSNDEKVILWKTNFEMKSVMDTGNIKRSEVKPVTSIMEFPSASHKSSYPPSCAKVNGVQPEFLSSMIRYLSVSLSQEPSEIRGLSMGIKSKENKDPSGQKQKMDEEKIERLTSTVGFLNEV